jgi:hypothetical protein
VPPVPFARPSAAFAVGHDPDPIASMRGADMSSTHHQRPAGVTSGLQVSENPVSAVSSEARDVLNENPLGSQLSHQPRELAPESASLAVDACSEPSGTDILAGEPSCDEIHGLELGVGDGSDVVKASDIWPVSSEHTQAEGVRLDLPSALHAGPLEAEIHASNPGKQASEPHGVIA